MSTSEKPAPPVISFLTWRGDSKDPLLPNAANPARPRRPDAPARGRSPAKQVIPRPELLLPGEPVAVDIEFQDYFLISEMEDGEPQWQNRVAWIGLVNTRFEVVLDAFAQYPDDPNVVHKLPRARGKTFGVTMNRLKEENGSVPADMLEKWCAKLFADRVVVLHSGTNDKKAFMYEKPFAGAHATHDTQIEYKGHEGKRQWGLAALAEDLLKLTIQQGGRHSPVEDAITTMKIYLRKNPYNRAKEAAQWRAVFRNPITKSATSSHAGRGGTGLGNGASSSRGGKNATNARGGHSVNGKSGTTGHGGTVDPKQPQVSSMKVINNITGPTEGATQTNIINSGLANITGPSRGGVQNNYINESPGSNAATHTRGGGNAGRGGTGWRPHDKRGSSNVA